MIKNPARIVVITGMATGFAWLPHSAGADTDWHGHLKYQPLLSSFTNDSLFTDYIASPSVDNNLDSRFNFKADSNAWTFDAHYQLLAKTGDSVELYRQLGALEVIAPFFPSDSRRLMNLSQTVAEGDRSLVVQRLDRLVVTYTTSSSVLKLGRQAISWGNGLMFNPMDFFNPFDPTAVDREYKTGDDMVYGQYLFANGSDAQFVWVGRRDADGEMSEKVTSAAGKYHGFIGAHEYDILVSRHYGEQTAALGGVWALGGSIARTDVVITETDRDTYVSGVANLSYSWTWGKHNVSGSVEYFRNGFGISDGDYSPLKLFTRPDLLVRLARAESFNLGRDYLAASAAVEMHPLWMLTPNIFYNLNDQSALLQLVSSHDLQQNLQLLVSGNLPLGKNGSEFGGIDSGVPDRYLSTRYSLFAQLAWYF